MSKKVQRRIIVKFYISAKDRDADKRSIGRPSVATTVRGFRKIRERYGLREGPYMAYFDENGNNLGGALKAEEYLSK